MWISKAGAQEWNMQQNDVILGALSFFQVSGGSFHVDGCVAQTWEHGLNSHQKVCHGTLFNSLLHFPEAAPGAWPGAE